MLDLIRKKQKSFLIQVVFWAIIATFVGTIFLVWGKGDDASSRSTDYAAKVNKTAISVDQVQTAYANIYRIYQNLYGEAFTPAIEKKLDLRKMALDSLIEQTLLLQEAERRDLDVSDKEIVDAIAKISAFQENGVFNRDRYVQVLRSQRLTPEQFEEMQHRDLLVEKARKAIEGEATASDAEIEEEYRLRNEKVDLAVIRVDPAAFEGKVKVDPAALQSFFAGRKEEFKLPETVNLQYLLLDPKQLAGEVQVGDADLERYYQRNLDRFETPEQVRAAHILVRVPQDAAPAVKAEKRAAIEKLRDRARKGEDFSALARANSEDPGSAAQGGDLGFFGRGTMVAPFENAAFNLSTGQVSDIVETDFGFHVIRLSERREARIAPMTEVADEVRAGAAAEKSREVAQEKAMDLFNVNRKGGGLNAIASSVGAQVRETGFFSRENPRIQAFAVSENLAATAFALTNGELGRPVLLPQGVLIYALKEKRAPHVPELAEVTPAVEAAFRKDKAKSLARVEADLILSELRSGADPAGVAAKRGLGLTETGLFAKDRNHFVPSIGTSEELSNAAFALSAAAPVPAKSFEVDGSWVAARMKERKSADPAGLTAAAREETKNAVLDRKKKDVLDKALKELRSAAEIVYAEAYTPAKEG